MNTHSMVFHGSLHGVLDQTMKTVFNNVLCVRFRIRELITEIFTNVTLIMVMISL